ncbi:hypothetical protein [Streptococcus phocae]|uniref:Uncharacterized protein n=1 Tax=Streptococcus phocae TaxID=119224 RepID=A0A0P6SLD2_9STRE|nr:hypothetical protein [Streptococcus phocae]KPJ22304.1 hypothetical protein AKK44_05440 [Streptococcus phocae]
MKNIIKKSLPLVAALSITATALPLSLATTTTVSARAYWEKEEKFKNQYFVDHWVETQKKDEWYEMREHNGKYFKLVTSEVKEGKFGEKPDEAQFKSTVYETNSKQYKNTDIVNIDIVGNMFDDEVNIYYYN